MYYGYSMSYEFGGYQRGARRIHSSLLFAVTWLSTTQYPSSYGSPVRDLCTVPTDTKEAAKFLSVIETLPFQTDYVSHIFMNASAYL